MADRQVLERIQNLKNKVTQMLKELSDKPDGGLPSDLWKDTLGFFDYMINLSPENYLNIRYHTSFLVGEYIFKYASSIPDPVKFAKHSGYEFLTRGLPDSYKIGEPPPLVNPINLGVNYNGKIINDPTVRYQQCISNLYNMGVFKLMESNKRNVILEVGGGYGGLAHHIGSITKNSTYLIIDLPAMLLYSGGYLISYNQDKNIYIYDKNTFTQEFIQNGMFSYDYVLLPNYALKDLKALKEINLMINTISFQEMTKTQISDYLELGASKLNGYLYSDNFENHNFNKEFDKGDTVTGILSGFFKLFPSPEFYDKYCRPYYNTALSRIYLGAGKIKGTRFPENGCIKIFNGPKMYSVYSNNNNSIKFRIERDWLRYFYKEAQALIKKLFHF